MIDLRIGGGEKVSPTPDVELEKISENIDHYAPIFLNNRVEIFRIMHGQNQPIRHSTNYNGYWFVTGYSAAVEIQRRAEDFSNKQKVVPMRPIGELIPSGLNPPEHRPVKIALAKLFMPKAVSALKAKLAEVAQSLFDELLPRGTFDVVQDLMFPLMSEFTMVHMLGLDPAKAAEYAGTIHAMSRPVQDAESAAVVKEGLAKIEAEFRDIMVDQRYDPACMLAKIAALDLGGRRFTPDEMVKVAFNFTIGGFGTTAIFTGSAFVFLARNPALRQKIVDDPGIIPTAFDELLRLMTPTQTFARRVERDTEVCGVQMKEGDQLLMGYGAANFDPRQFPNPESVNLRRAPNRHMSFGTGPHRCLGEPIARAVVGEVLAQMVARIPDYSLVEEGVVAQSHSSSMFGYSNVPIRF